MQYRIRKFRAADMSLNQYEYFAAEYQRTSNGEWREYSGVVSRKWEACYAFLETKATPAQLQALREISI